MRKFILMTRKPMDSVLVNEVEVYVRDEDVNSFLDFMRTEVKDRIQGFDRGQVATTELLGV